MTTRPTPAEKPRPLRDAALAFTLLSVAPVRVGWRAQERPDIAGWFPLVGAALGGLAAGALWAVCALGGALGITSAPPGDLVTRLAWPLAVLLVAAWALASRLLHWDGLADTADGLGGAHDPAARREIMSDSATGAFGVTAVVFVALLQTASLAGLLGSGPDGSAALYAVIVVTPVIGRLAATFSCWLGTPAKPGGLGASTMGRPRVPGALATISVLGGCAVLLWVAAGGMWLGWFAGGIVAAAVIPHLIAARVGGVTGDTMGASVLLTEAVVLLAATTIVVIA